MDMLSYNEIENLIIEGDWKLDFRIMNGVIKMAPKIINADYNWINKIVKYGNVIMVDHLNEHEMKEHYKQIRSLNKGLVTIKDFFSDMSFVDDECLDLEKKLNTFFSKEFIQQNNLIQLIQKRLKGVVVENEIDLNNYEKAIRFEEDFDQYRVVLSHSIYSKKVHIALEEKGKYHENPVTDYFDWTYSYDSYWSAIKSHSINFFEIASSKSFPEAHYNNQFFKIIYNVGYEEGKTKIEILKSSARTQIKSINKLLKILYIVFGEDVNEDTFESLNKEKVKNDYDEYTISYYLGYKLFDTPFWNIEIAYRLHNALDDDDELHQVAGLEVNVYPYLKEKDNFKEGPVYLHPLIYDWEK